MMPLNKTKELAQVVDESILPLEHSGGDGWTILHGDTLQIIRAFKPQVFDALITDPPYASGGWKPSEKNRTTNQKYSSMSPDKALPGPEKLDEMDGGVAVRRPESLQARSACLPVHRLAAVPLHHRRFAMGRVDLERMRGMG